MSSDSLRPICFLIGAAAFAGILASCASTGTERRDDRFDSHLDRAYKIEDAQLDRRAKMSNRADAQADKRWERMTQ